MGASLFLGRRLGELFYYFDARHSAAAYANIKTAFAQKLSPSEIRKITKEFYRAFGQHFIEIFLIPLIDKAYIDKYVHVEGLEYINEAFKKGKGIILLGMHEGSWELSNIVCANFGFAYNMFVRQQKYPRLGKLLDGYRTHKGCKIIQRENELRQLVRLLKDNQAIGMSIDQGGRSGCAVNFFGKDASMSIGAVKVALKYDAVIVPVFSARIKGAHIKFIVEPPFDLKRSANPEKDAEINLQELVKIFERRIAEYPQEYLWSYKIWKYSKERNIVILSDLRAGHLRQAEAVAKIAADYFKSNAVSVNTSITQIKFRNKFAKLLLSLSGCVSAKFNLRGCLWCLRMFLGEDTYRGLIGKKPDIIISCGSSLAAVNYILSRENNAKSIVVLRPSFLSMRKFDLVIMPRHDNPSRRNNVVIIEGALNLIDDRYLKEQSERLISSSAAFRPSGGLARDFLSSPSLLCIGLLIGGDAKNFILGKDSVAEVIRQVRQAAEKLGADILVTTSRRTSKEVEALIKEGFKDEPRCKLLVIANEKNIPEAVGGILGLSRIIVVSPESISMISEAVNSQKYVLAFDSFGLDKKHRLFVRSLEKNKYLYLSKPGNLSGAIEDILKNTPLTRPLRDNFLVSEAIKKIL